jgi:hypothetical protein
LWYIGYVKEVVTSVHVLYLACSHNDDFIKPIQEAFPFILMLICCLCIYIPTLNKSDFIITSILLVDDVILLVDDVILLVDDVILLVDDVILLVDDVILLVDDVILLVDDVILPF